MVFSSLFYFFKFIKIVVLIKDWGDTDDHAINSIEENPS